MILLTLQQYVAAVIGCLADCGCTCCIAMKYALYLQTGTVKILE
jgi:hypothetical protein